MGGRQTPRVPVTGTADLSLKRFGIYVLKGTELQERVFQEDAVCAHPASILG